jgi:hypothetical protein
VFVFARGGNTDGVFAGPESSETKNLTITIGRGNYREGPGWPPWHLGHLRLWM